MKKIKYVLAMFAFTVCFMLQGVSVSADSSGFEPCYVYYAKAEWENTESSQYDHKYKVEHYDSTVPLFWYYQESNDDTIAYVRLGIVDKENSLVYSATKDSINNLSGYLNFYAADNIYKKDSTNIYKFSEYEGTHETSYFSNWVYCRADIGTENLDGMIFRSLGDAEEYYAHGNTDGLIKTPDPDYDTEHDFGNDDYDAEIDVPQLSSLSHNGFKVNNMQDDYYIDVIMKSEFFGAKHLKTSDGLKSYYNICADLTDQYASHYWNLSDQSNIAVNDSCVDILSLWNVDNVSILANDFRNWSAKYPSHRKLPDYDFFQHQSSQYEADFNFYHVYISDGSRSDLTQVTMCAQARTTYYVRFYTYNQTDGFKYGRWVYYSFLDGQVFNGSKHDDEIHTGNVGSDQDGNPVNDSDNWGSQDQDGNTSYDRGDSGTATFDASDMWATLQKLVVSMGQVPDLISAVFSFLPSWLIGMIACGIASLIVLRFAGR